MSFRNRSSSGTLRLALDYQRVASELTDPLICAKFVGMAEDAEAIARVKALCEPDALASH